MKQKIKEFIEKYGFTYKAYFLALIIFPPAGIAVAWKIPGLQKMMRIALSLIALVLPPLVVFLSGLFIANMVKLFT